MLGLEINDLVDETSTPVTKTNGDDYEKPTRKLTTIPLQSKQMEINP